MSILKRITKNKMRIEARIGHGKTYHHVDINITKGFPFFRGRDLKEETRQQIREVYAIIALSQLRPVLASAFLGQSMVGSKSKEEESQAEELIIYKSITK